MRGKSLVTLAILATLAALAAVWMGRTPGPAPGEEIGAALYPELAAGLNDIDRIELTFGASSEQVTLERAEASWRVAQKSGYRADAGKIRQLLLRLSEAEILELKTANPEFYGRLGVASVTEEDADGARVDLVGMAAPVSVIVGRRETRAGAGTYVRRDGEARSYLIDAELDPGNDATDWLDTDIIDVDASMVREVTIVHPDGEMLRLLGIDGRLTLAELPEGRELSGPTATDPIGRALSSLSFEDVLPEAEFDGGEPAAVATYGLSDGRVVEVRAWRTDTDRYLALDVTLAPAPEPAAAAQPADADTAADAATQAASDSSPDEDATADTETTAGTAAEPSRADADAVARDRQRLAGWIYKVPTYKFDQVFIRTEGLLRPLPEQPAAD